MQQPRRRKKASISASPSCSTCMSQTCMQHLAGKPHRVVLQERVPGSDPPHFRLHLKPGTPKPGNKGGQVISRAGAGPGLQVAPGSVSEVTNTGVLARAGQNRVCLTVLKVLICSQLPFDTTYPLDISLRVLPPPDEQQGQWTARICQDGKGWRVWLGAAHLLFAYAGRSISKMSLSQDRQLTVTLTPTAAAPAAPAPAPALPIQQAAAAPPADQTAAAAAAAAPTAGLQAAREQSQLPLKRPAAGSPTQKQQQQQQPVTAGQVPGSQAAAAAAARGTSAQAAVTRKKPRRRTQQQQQQQAMAMMAAAAAAAALVRSALLSVTQGGAGAVQMNAAAHNSPPAAAPAAAAACVQIFDDDITTAAGMPAAPVPTIKQEAATQEVLDLTADSVDGDGSPAAAAASPTAAAAARAAAPAAAAAAPAANLPACLQLPPASTPAEIERALVGLMTATLLPLLPRETYVNVMMRLRELFEPMKRGALAAERLQQLQSNYVYVQAVVYGGRLRDVVAALAGLDAV